MEHLEDLPIKQTILNMLQVFQGMGKRLFTVLGMIKNKAGSK